jgi:hypothetical protein
MVCWRHISPKTSDRELKVRGIPPAASTGKSSAASTPPIWIEVETEAEELALFERCINYTFR